MKYYKIIRIILILIPIIILGCLVYKDFVSSGYLKVDYDFCREDPFISKFSPKGRVLDIQTLLRPNLRQGFGWQEGFGGQEVCIQRMVIDPVYFDVRLPQKFNLAQLKIWYQKESDVLLKIGPSVDLANWEWYLKDVRYVRNENEWQIGIASYDLKNSRMDKNNLRFLISSPGLDTTGKEIVFNKVEIEFIKEPLSKDNWKSRVKDWLINIYDKFK